MPSTPLYDRTGKAVGSVELSDELFAAPVNAAVLHQVREIAPVEQRLNGFPEFQCIGKHRQ